MKLPKGFGGQGGLGGLMQQMQGAMARAKDLDNELAQESLSVSRGPVTVTVNGLGEIQAVKIDPSAVDPSDVEMLEDLIVSASRDSRKQRKFGMQK
jgi:DNA-binding YbaB/EbfC family protein